MADNAETQNNQLGAEERVREQIRKEAREINQIADDTEKENARQQLEERLKRELEQRKTAVREVERKGVKDTRQEAREVRQTVAKVLEAIKEGIIKPPEKTNEILSKIAEKGLTDETSVHLHRFIQKYLNKDVTFSQSGQEKTEFEKDLEALKEKDPTAAELISESIISSAEQLGLTEVTAREKFKVEETYTDQDSEKRKVRIRGSEVDLTTFEGRRELTMDKLGISGTGNTYIPTERELSVAEALTSPEDFIDFVQKIENKLSEKDNQWAGKSDEEKQKLVSEKVELEIVLFFDNIFKHLDVSKPTQYYEEVTRKDPFYNFQIVFERVEKQLAILADNLASSRDQKVREFVDRSDFTFWKKGQYRVDEERVYGENEEIKYVLDKIKAFPTRIKAHNVVDFVQYLKVIVAHEQESREYTHNSQAIFFNPAGEKGFYERLAAYAEKMRSTDIDQLLLLPDDDKFMRAFDLYHSMMEKEYSKYDWQHPPSLFDLFMSHTNKIEDKVLSQLKVLYKGQDVEEWRLRRALKLAVGASLGIFMNDVEMAAYADPSLAPDGTFAFTSYYRNDSAALGPLNTFQHDFWRWQQEGTLMADLLFLPIKGKLPRFWNHTILFDQMRKYKESYLHRNLDPLNDGRIRLIDILNIARVGGPLTRSGWRGFYSYDKWLIYETKNVDGKTYVGDKLNYLESWKALENIGFETVFNFVGKFKSEDFTEPQKEELFKYLYQKYIKPGASDREFTDYYSNLVNRAERGEKPGEKAKGADDVYKFEIFRAMSGMLRDRVPTKFLRLERGRFTPGGKKERIWDSLQKSNNMPIDQFDETVENILLAESLLREEISQRMIKWINEPGNSERSFNDMEINDYKLTPDRLEELLKGKLEQGEIDTAKEVLTEMLNTKLGDDYLERFSGKLEKRAQDGERTDLPFEIAPEELELRLISFRTTGPRTLARALGELSESEQKVHQHLKNFSTYLKKAALDGKRDISEVVGAIGEIQGFLEKIHGKAYSYQVADHLAGVVVSYFKKDTAARSIFSKWFRIGKYNSMAARLAGVYRGVWEWEVGDIDRFAVALERERILPKDPYDYSKPPKIVQRKIFGMIPFGKKEIREKAYEYYGKKFRSEYGATGKHIIYELMQKYLPLIILFAIWQAISRAFKEELGEKKG